MVYACLETALLVISLQFFRRVFFSLRISLFPLFEQVEVCGTCNIFRFQFWEAVMGKIFFAEEINIFWHNFLFLHFHHLHVNAVCSFPTFVTYHVEGTAPFPFMFLAWHMLYYGVFALKLLRLHGWEG